MSKSVFRMMAVLFCFVLITGLSVSTSEGKTNGIDGKKGLKELTLKDLKMDGFGLIKSPFNPLNDEPVYYKEVKVSKYDTFFKDSAIILGTVIIAEELARAIEAEETVPVDVVEFLLKTLPMALTKSKDLLKNGKELSGQVKSDFKGLNARKAPGVSKGITTSMDNLQKSADKIPGIIETLKKI